MRYRPRNGLQHAVFLFLYLPAVLLLTFAAPRRARNVVLLIASLLFYAWAEPTFVLVMLASIALNYTFGLLVGSLARSGASHLSMNQPTTSSRNELRSIARRAMTERGLLPDFSPAVLAET